MDETTTGYVHHPDAALYVFVSLWPHRNILSIVNSPKNTERIIMLEFPPAY